MQHKVHGVEEGALWAVLPRFKERGLDVFMIIPDFNSLWGRRPVGAMALSVFFQDLARMLAVGLPLITVLGILETTARGHHLRQASRDIARKIAEGEGVARAFNLSGVFGGFCIRSLSAGEVSGDLGEAAFLLSEHYAIMAGTRDKVWGVIVYPLIVIFILLVGMTYVVLRVMPQLAPLFPDNVFSSWLSGVVSHAGQGLSSYGMVMAGLAVTVTIAAGAWITRERKFRPMVLRRVPLLSDIFKDLELGMLFFDLYLLNRSGISLEASLHECSGEAGNQAGERLNACRPLIRSGIPLSEALRSDEYFPAVIADTLRIGEETGQYAEYFKRLHEYFYSSFERRITLAGRVAEPVLLAVSAVFIAGFAMAFLQPVYANLTNISMLKP
jgi:type II secretory pathway component PulF